jgi:hypothetical protein
MANISPVLQYLLSRPSFNGPRVTPGFDLTAPFVDPSAANPKEPTPQEQLMNDQYPKWLAAYLGGGDETRGRAILDYAKQ